MNNKEPSVKLKEEMSHLASHLSQKEKQLEVLERGIRQLEGDKKDLTEEVSVHKWEHVLTKKELTKTKRKLDKALKKIDNLEDALRIAKLPKNSSNSSRSPSTDFYNPKRGKNYSLREKTDRRTGGQPGHKGSTLKFSHESPDEDIFHSVDRCSHCGRDLTDVVGEEDAIHQVVDIAEPKRLIINHTTVAKRCSCGKCNRAVFPAGTKGPVNYGSGVRALIANLSVRQYMPYHRTAEFMKDVFDIPMSEGSISNLLTQFENSAQESYNNIHQQVFQSSVAGADETSIKVNGKKNWIHTYQTKTNTFIGFHPSRGIKAREHFYPDGLPNSILVSDCLAMQLSTPAIKHQLCLAHLLRELNGMEEAHPQCPWPKMFKKLLIKSLRLKDCPYQDKRVKKVLRDLEKLLHDNQANAPGKIPAFWKRMNKHSDKILTFLEYKEVPPDNNGSERAIRNAKVKQKISGQFKTADGARQYVVIRSVIDTLNKQGKNVHEELSRIASL